MAHILYLLHVSTVFCLWLIKLLLHELQTICLIASLSRFFTPFLGRVWFSKKGFSKCTYNTSRLTTFVVQIERALTSGSFKESSAKPKMSSKDGVIFLRIRRTLNSSPLENDMLDNYDPFLLG